MIPAHEPIAPCPHCGATRAALTCTCLGCPDVTPSCVCQPGVDELVAHEGLCPQCVGAGCNATLADFTRCRRRAGA